MSYFPEVLSSDPPAMEPEVTCNGVEPWLSELICFVGGIVLYFLAFSVRRSFSKKLATLCSAERSAADAHTREYRSPKAVAQQDPASFHLALAQVVEPLLHKGIHYGILKGKLCSWLATCPAEIVTQALVRLLEDLGASAACPELLIAVRGVLREFGLRIPARLGELVLEAYLDLGLVGEFDDVLAELETLQINFSNIGLLAVRRSELALGGCGYSPNLGTSEQVTTELEHPRWCSDDCESDSNDEFESIDDSPCKNFFNEYESYLNNMYANSL